MLMCGVKITVCESHDPVPHLDYKKQHEEWCTKRQIQSYWLVSGQDFFSSIPSRRRSSSVFIFMWMEKANQKKRGRWNRMEVNHNAIKGNRLVYFSLMCLLFEVLFQSLLFPLVTFILHLGWSHVKQRKGWWEEHGKVRTLHKLYNEIVLTDCISQLPQCTNQRTHQIKAFGWNLD